MPGYTDSRMIRIPKKPKAQKPAPLPQPGVVGGLVDRVLAAAENDPERFVGNVERVVDLGSQAYEALRKDPGARRAIVNAVISNAAGKLRQI